MQAKLPHVSLALERPRGAPRLVTMKEAMHYGRWGRDKLLQLISTNKVIAYKDGWRVLVDLDSVDNYRLSLPRVVVPAPRYKRRRR